MELLRAAVPIAVLVFVVSSMLAVGLGLTVGEIVAPLRNVRLVGLAILANFVLMPLCAYAVARALTLDQPFGVGLLILGTAAGAPFLPKLAGIAKGNLAFAVGLSVLLMVLTVGYMPLVLPLLLQGASVDAGKIARSLIFLMLIPLGLGLALHAWSNSLAAWGRPILDRLSTLSLIVLITLITIVNFDKVLGAFGTRSILGGIVFLALGFGIGYVMCGPAPDTRRVLALGTSQRNIAAALMVGGQNFSDPKVIVMVIVVAIVGLLLLVPLSRWLAGRG